MSTAVTGHPSLSKTSTSVAPILYRSARPRRGPSWFLAAFGIVPLAVAASIAFLTQAVALVTAFALMVIAACALAGFALEMAADEGGA